jgi:hypothetical protein
MLLLPAIELRIVGRPARRLITVPTELYASVMGTRQYETGYVYLRLGIYSYSLLWEGIGRIISREVYGAGGFVSNSLKTKIGLNYI